MSQPSSQQSFSMSQPSQGALGPPGYRGPYDNTQKLTNDGPQIYSAVYSGVDVYEMEVQGVAVMRRRNDSWLNATQVLKVAGVEKGKRTKILEREIQTGEHEKVQGGYGKYQGTWIKFDRAVEVCRQYGVEELLRPLLTYDMGQDGGVAGRGDFNTPTKEQAMAAQRKRMYNANNETRTNGLSGTFFKNISSTASHAVAAISKARFESPGPRSRGAAASAAGPTRAPSFSRQPSMHNADDLPANSQQSYASDYGQPVSQSQFSTQQSLQLSETEPPRKRQRVTMTPADSFGGYAASHAADLAQEFPGSPTEPNESFIYSNAAAAITPHDGYSPVPPMAYDASPEGDMKRSLLMGLFMDSLEQSPEEVLRKLSPADLDTPIDAQSHTALHWAATLSRMPLLRCLIASGANAFRVNAAGETALMRACTVTNSMDLNSFRELLDVLGHTIEVVDSKGRTALHHIAITSAVKGRNAASKYYLETLLEWVVRQGSAPSGQGLANGDAPHSSQAQSGTRMGIGRFMTEVVNVQDHSGDTALNIAARIGNRSIISQLLEVHADPNIANRAGLRPVDFGIGKEEMVAPDAPAGDGADKTNAAPGESQRSRESSDEILSSLTHLVNEPHLLAQAELKAKQAVLDSLHSALRSVSAQLSETRRNVEQLSETVRKQQLARQRVANLSDAREEEQRRLMQEQKRQGKTDATPTGAWETELGAILEAAGDSDGGAAGLLPSSAILKARLAAVTARRDVTHKMAAALKGCSRDVEVKYRRVVSICTGVPESEVDAVVDSLLRAVESEKGELEIGRVRRFLGGVEGITS